MSTLFQLTMTAADGTSIDTLTPSVGSSMAVFSGLAPQTTSNRARRRTGSSNNNARTNQVLSSADYAVELSLQNLTVATNDIVRIQARCADMSNGYFCSWFGNTFTLRKTVAGVNTNYGTYSYTPTSGVDFTIRLEVEQSGSNVLLRFYEGGTLRISGTDTGNSFPTASNAGFSVASDAPNDPTTTGFAINSMLVETLASAPTTRRPTFLRAVRRVVQRYAPTRLWTGTTKIDSTPTPEPGTGNHLKWITYYFKSRRR